MASMYPPFFPRILKNAFATSVCKTGSNGPLVAEPICEIAKPSWLFA